MVVDHIQDHAEAQVMRAIDETPQIVGNSIQMARREQIDAVVAPAKTPGKLRDRHHFNGRDADLCQRRQMIHRRAPRAFAGECPDVKFVEYLPVEVEPRPGMVGPFKRVRIDDLRWSMRSEWLGSRGWIGKTRGTV